MVFIWNEKRNFKKLSNKKTEKYHKYSYIQKKLHILNYNCLTHLYNTILFTF